MRLICGLLTLDGSDAAADVLEAMADQMPVPRLRPAVSMWRQGPVGLAVLHFGVRNGPAQPMPQPLPTSRALTLAADVRLDAPDALALDLGHRREAGDDRLLLAALERGGHHGLRDVLGDFAFALWRGSDTGEGRLLCGRDMFGVRPFFYVHQPGKVFAFASLPKALYGSGIVPKVIDEEAVLRRLTMRFVDDDSLVAGIRRLPPAHVMEVSRAGVAVSRYWQLDRGQAGRRKMEPQEAADELRRLVDEAVRCRLPADVNVGSHLSGGLDSSSIAVLAARQLRQQGKKLHAYSFLDRRRNDVTLEDETDFVQAVLDQEPDIAWTAVRPPVDPGFAAPKDADTMAPAGGDDPDNAVCAGAERQGVSLILSGWGGDEGATFNGRGALAELLLRGQWHTMAREISQIARERAWPVRNIVSNEILRYVLPERAIAIVDGARGREPGFEALTDRMLQPAFRRRLAAAREERIALSADGRENRWRLLTSPHIAERTEGWALAGARHGLAFAFPLLDVRVVEFALSLPSALFLRGGYRRQLFRDAMAGVLPEKVRLRHLKYQAFPGIMIDIVENKTEMLALIDGYAGNAAVGRLIDLAALRRMVEELPAADTVREQMRTGRSPAAAAALMTASDVLAVAAYIEQHGAASAETL